MLRRGRRSSKASIDYPLRVLSEISRNLAASGPATRGLATSYLGTPVQVS